MMIHFVYFPTTVKKSGLRFHGRQVGVAVGFLVYWRINLLMCASQFSLYPQRDQWILKAYVIIIINRQAALCAAQE